MPCDKKWIAVSFQILSSTEISTNLYNIFTTYSLFKNITAIGTFLSNYDNECSSIQHTFSEHFHCALKNRLVRATQRGTTKTQPTSPQLEV